MNRNDDDSGSGAAGSAQPGTPSQHKGKLPDGLGKDIASRENAVVEDEAAVLGREKSATAREDAVHSREGAVDLREEAATSREGEIRAGETLQAASADHILMLQQANEHLIIATLEAQRLTEEVQAGKAQLELAKSVAEKANRAKSDFLSSMSHELRSPLNAILGFAQLLEASSPPPTPTQKARIEQILRAGWYLLELVNEVLDLSLIESGKLSLSLEPLSLAEVLLDCQVMIEPQAQKNGIRMSFPRMDGPCLVNADRTRLKQVLVNLLSNAIKYNRAGGVVEVACSTSAAGRTRISVKDCGEGLATEKLEQLFQSFNRLGQEASAVEGTGIGLVVSKQLVELMGGDIGVESTVGVGSVFWIELNPAAVPQHAAGAGKPLALLPARVRHGVALRTLLHVEDNQASMLLVEQLIARRPDMRFLSAENGMRGIALARIHQPDVILMDVNLPDISGLQALKILREDPATVRIPVLALSANAMPGDIEKGLAAGFFRYLTKPIEIRALMDALNRALELAQAGSGDAADPDLP